MLPKDGYFKTIERMKDICKQTKRNSNSDYYLLSKHEIYQCGNVEKVTKKRQPLLYYMSVLRICMMSYNEVRCQQVMAVETEC